MKNISIILKVFFFLSMTVAFWSCEDWFDINTSQDNPVVVTVDQGMPLVVFYASQICYDHAEYGMYLGQALTTGGRSKTGSYGYKNGWELLSMNRHPQWRRHFYDVGVNANELIKAAQKIDAKNIELIARTIIVHSTLLTTDAFGDMPRSQVYKSDAPPYDTQESVYEWMTQEVDELIRLYNDEAWISNQNKIITERMDRIFKGDMAKWRAFTKALKARILLRKLPNWDNTPAARQSIINAVDAALNDPDYEDAIYKYDGGTAEQNCPWGPAQPKLNLGWAQARENLLLEALPTTFFCRAILGSYPISNDVKGLALDPRAGKMMSARSVPSSATEVQNKTKSLRHLESNIGMDVSMKINYYPDMYASEGGNPYTKNDGYVMLMSEEELLFIKAEAQYWNEDKNGAYQTTLKAVERSFVRYDVTFDANDEDAQYRKDLFYEVRLPGAALFTISDLMQQKYVAMYLQPELWTDVRRYNYSSEQNGIQYDGAFVYTVKTCVNDNAPRWPEAEDFTTKYSLRRPYNLYEAYWNTPDNYGTAATLSPNAWITRLNYDPETEDKYNKVELERLGAYKNPEWLKKRMVWARKNNSYVTAADPTEWK